MSPYRSLIGAIAGFLAFVQTVAWAGSPTDQLRPALEEMIRILDDPSLKPESKTPERQARVRAAVVDLFDFPEIARRTLGPHWRSLSEPEREEFIGLFRSLLEHTYLPKIALYQGERVRFVGESVDGDLATVQTLVITRDRKEVPVSYRLRQHDGHWLVYDISVNGISLTANYRSQFNEIIRRGSYQELVRRIRQKLDSPPATKSSGVLSDVTA
jgi:phospholipid transport system substrate-binding protein